MPHTLSISLFFVAIANCQLFQVYPYWFLLTWSTSPLAIILPSPSNDEFSTKQDKHMSKLGNLQRRELSGLRAFFTILSLSGVASKCWPLRVKALFSFFCQCKSNTTKLWVHTASYIPPASTITWWFISIYHDGQHKEFKLMTTACDRALTDTDLILSPRILCVELGLMSRKEQSLLTSTSFILRLV